MDTLGLTARGVGTKVAAVFEGFGWRIAGLVCEELNLGTVDDSRDIRTLEPGLVAQV